MQRRERVGVALGTIATLLLLSGCTTTVTAPVPNRTRTSAQAPTSQAPSTPTSPTPKTSATSPTTAVSSTPASPSTRSDGSAAATTAHPTLNPPGCTPSTLDITLSANNGAGGTAYQDIILHNTGWDTCSLKGYPTVEVVGGGNGTRIGLPLDHSYWAYSNNATDNPQVNVSPGARAYAQLAVPEIYNYATGKPGKDAYHTHLNSTCGHAVRADGYRIYLPGEHTATYIPVRGGFPYCSNPHQHFARNSEVVPKPTAQ